MFLPVMSRLNNKSDGPAAHVVCPVIVLYQQVKCCEKNKNEYYKPTQIQVLQLLDKSRNITYDDALQGGVSVTLLRSGQRLRETKGGHTW